MESPTTLRDAILWFADFEHCREFMVELRWTGAKVACPQCSSEKLTRLDKQRVWKCYAGHPRPTFSLKTGTIFEDSPIALEKWLCAAWLLISCKNGISSYEIHRGLKVTQKTAWFMLQRIRLAMKEAGYKLGGEVEVDETFIGAKARNMHANKRAAKIHGRGPDGKEIVFGMVERGGKVIAGHVDSRTKKELQPLIRERKRGLHGTYISVEPYHLFRYIDEQAFRYNTRKMTDAERFAIVMKQIVGRRLTYKELTGKLLEDGRSNLLPGSAKDAGNEFVF